ncbi:MAG: alpha/beta hydrolase [Leptospiraceae bacterium]|nr:alpha/beta hydrolase [Leptospiraceae bacterium]
MSPSEMDTQALFKKNNIETYHYQITISKMNIHFVRVGKKEFPTVIFVHGSPGSWDNYRKFMIDKSLLSKYQLISLDRPGFGKSQKGKPVIELKKQAEVIHGIIRYLGIRVPVILVGHSYGGPVVVRTAVDYPEEIGKLVLVAASVSPDLEVIEWYQKVANWRFVRWILPSFLDVSNQEILPLKKELLEMIPLWKQIRIPVVIIQGDDDSLVPPGNAYFAKEKLIHSEVKFIMVKDLNHFVPWKRPDLIMNSILDR